MTIGKQRSTLAHLRLVSSRPTAQPARPRAPTDHPCLDAFQLEFDYLLRSLARLGVPRPDVEDLAHEVFLVLYQTWEKYDPTRPFRAYLFGIAFRVAQNHLRKRRREVLYPFLEVDDFQQWPDQLVEAKQQRMLVLKALEHIPMLRRAVLVMHDIDELPMAEIAATLSMHRFTGYSRLRKARKEFAAAVASLYEKGTA
jgi:RNA polymerase sigma factor (sigma-70 family)